jgi:cellulose synthase/poly-beta-1,6-N-acetylglucosamine synthase-like glycosyltransferase
MAELVILIFLGVLLAGYAVLIGLYRHWFLKVHPFKFSEDVTASTRFSVIIPARNEEAIIEACLTSVLQQNYPIKLFEVIVIDDHSTDSTAAIIRNLQKQYVNLQLIQLADVLQGQQLNSYKKKALEHAISKAAGEWIVTTDADCIVTSKWLKTIAAFIEDPKLVFVAAPVKYTNTGSSVSIFQCLDFMTLQGITAAAVHNNFHSMCNGANLTYNKKAFYEVGGFAGIDTIASGDDMLLMHKIYERYPSGIGFLLSRDAVVSTMPMPTWKTFFNQRIRWASKADKYKDKRIFTVLLLVYILNVSFIVLPILSLWNSSLWLYWIIMLTFKTLVELSFIYPVSIFFKEEKILWWFPLMQPVHIMYTIVAGWLGKFGKYTWKGRQVS